jgi:hypothetical protein
MTRACLAVAAAVATLAAAGFSHAAVGPRAQPVLPAAQPASPTVQLVNGPTAAHPRGAELVVMTDVSAPAARSAWSEAPGSAKPIYSNVLGAPPAPRNASEAPLPGALWLFGSALLAFLGISARRRF